MSNTVLLVDDHDAVLKGWEVVIKHEPELHIVGMTGDGEGAVELASRLGPDVVLMDVELKSLNGLDAAERILNEKNNHSRVLFVSGFDDNNDYICRAFLMGASGFLSKTKGSAELICALRAAVRGSPLTYPDDIHVRVRQYLRENERAADLSAQFRQLSDQERAVLSLLTAGRTNAEIGRELFVTEDTVKDHVRTTYRKLGVKNRVQAVNAAREAGFIK